MSATAEAFTCPLPLRDYPRITLAHGGGGQLGADLVRELFLPAFGEAGIDAQLTDAALLGDQLGRIAFTTDSHVVNPLFFPGGDIGTLAVNGTVNDLAMVGAKPLALSTAFILEEGLELAVLNRVATSMGIAAARAGVRLVTGDTKVVEAGHGDGIYVTTAGVGVVPAGCTISPARARAGDVIIASGPIGRHGIAVMSQREGLEFGTTITSDCAPLGTVVADLVDHQVDVHVLRDLTRGGLAASLCELAEAANLGVEIERSLLPIPGPVRAACGFLGLDPVAVANEGTFVAFVAPDHADLALEVMGRHYPICEPAAIGNIVDDHHGRVIERTLFGGRRTLIRPLGEQLPRIC